jgi:multiple sugar transport system permease protein
MAVGARRRRRLALWSSGGFSILFALALIFPVAWMVLTSFKPTDEIFNEVPRLLPEHPTLVHYVELLGETTFLHSLRNSVVVAVCTAVAAVVIATLFAYALSRFTMIGRMQIFATLFVTQVFPSFLLLIPIFMIFSRLHLTNTMLGLVLAHLTFAIPFSTMLLKSYFDALPVETEQAAMVDGCSPLGVVFRIVVPIAKPALAAVGLFSFILSWQEFLFALTLNQAPDLRTVPVALGLMVGENAVLWGRLMAGATLVTIPAVILFLTFQRYLVAGLTAGSVKG